uniref:ATP synthase subunit s-like protein n=1 Tax=Ixodes ricinus TaxID=34613 RepID=A0A131XX70_IXORI
MLRRSYLLLAPHLTGDLPKMPQFTVLRHLMRRRKKDDKMDNPDLIPPDTISNVFTTLVPRKGIGVDFASFLHRMPLYFTEEARRERQEKQILHRRLSNQKFYAERHGILGPDLAAASFLVFRGAAVKFHGKDDWYRKAEDGSTGLPQSYEEGWRVEAVDASEVELLYEGLDNLTNLGGLKALRLCGCPFVDDWFLDRLSQFKDSLEQLDLSGCPQITHRGLSALYRLRNLKTLTLRYLSHVEHLQLVALMLEDAIPGLEVKGVDFSLPPPSTDNREEAQADGLDIGTRS